MMMMWRKEKQLYYSDAIYNKFFLIEKRVALLENKFIFIELSKVGQKNEIIYMSLAVNVKRVALLIMQ